MVEGGLKIRCSSEVRLDVNHSQTRELITVPEDLL